MRWKTTLAACALAVLMAGPALAQQGHEMDRRGEMMGGHEGMMGHGSMFEMIIARADALDLTPDQVERLKTLDERFEAERERHHEAMRSIHEEASGVLTDEQRDAIHEMFEEMHEEGGMMKGHGRGMDDDEYDDDHDMDDHEMMEGHDMDDHDMDDDSGM